MEMQRDAIRNPFRIMMLKKHLSILIALSLAIHLCFLYSYPLIRDELNVWNLYNSFNQNFSEFWHHFIKYDTQQPLFYLFWYPLFREDLSVVLLRLPSLLMFLGSLFYWNKLFPFAEEDNKVPWILFLFTPFLTMYSTFFLSYSLLILTSIFNFYTLDKIEKQLNLKNFLLFLGSCILLALTHYYGALQALLLSLYLIYNQKSSRGKIFLSLSTIALIIGLLTTTYFLNNFSVIHNYRKIPHTLDILGYFNLLLGGRYVAGILLFLILFKKKISIFKSRELVFIIIVILIAYAKTVLVSPSLEARYLLILIYPLYKLTTNLQVKYITPILILASLYSFYILEHSFSPIFVIDYSKIQKDLATRTGFLTGPCPRFYFPETNYVCKGYLQNKYEILYDVENIIVDQYNFESFKKTIPDSKCTPIGQGLNRCTLPPDEL